MSILSAQKRDGNEREIVQALRAAGVYVKEMDAKAGFDLLTAWGGRIELIEVKNKNGRGKRLTENEKRLREQLQARGADVHIVCDIYDALNVYGLAWL